MVTHAANNTDAADSANPASANPASGNPASANPASGNPASAPKNHAGGDWFSENFFKIIPLFFLVASLVVAGVLILFMIILSSRDYPEPGFIRDLTDGQYEMLVHDPSSASHMRPGPAEDNFFRPGYAYLLLRTDADIPSKLESMNGQGFRFVPLDDLDEKDLWGRARFESTEEILNAIRPLIDVPLEGNCRTFLSEGDRENTYVCWFPETKRMLVIKSDFWKKWYADAEEQGNPRP